MCVSPSRWAEGALQITDVPYIYGELIRVVEEPGMSQRELYLLEDEIEDLPRGQYLLKKYDLVYESHAPI